MKKKCLIDITDVWLSRLCKVREDCCIQKNVLNMVCISWKKEIFFALATTVFLMAFLFFLFPNNFDLKKKDV